MVGRNGQVLELSTEGVRKEHTASDGEPWKQGGACCKPFKVLGVIKFPTLLLREIRQEANRHVMWWLPISLGAGGCQQLHSLKLTSKYFLMGCLSRVHLLGWDIQGHEQNNLFQLSASYTKTTKSFGIYFTFLLITAAFAIKVRKIH